MKAFSKGGLKTAHIDSFRYNKENTSVFYGILRGTGMAMRYHQFRGSDFWYLDNGYFDAIYMNKGKLKDMSGKYRVVKNDMIEPINIQPKKVLSGEPRLLIISPSPYTAFMYDTTPEDWNMKWAKLAMSKKMPFKIRSKETEISLEEELKNFDAVIAFNSISVMKAIEMDKSVFTTHGVIRNSDMFGEYVPYYDLDELKKFYEPKQFTLEEIEDRGIKCLS